MKPKPTPAAQYTTLCGVVTWEFMTMLFEMLLKRILFAVQDFSKQWVLVNCSHLLSSKVVIAFLKKRTNVECILNAASNWKKNDRTWQILLQCTFKDQSLLLIYFLRFLENTYEKLGKLQRSLPIQDENLQSSSNYSTTLDI